MRAIESVNFVNIVTNHHELFNVRFLSRPKCSSDSERAIASSSWSTVAKKQSVGSITIINQWDCCWLVPKAKFTQVWERQSQRNGVKAARQNNRSYSWSAKTPVQWQRQSFETTSPSSLFRHADLQNVILNVESTRFDLVCWLSNHNICGKRRNNAPNSSAKGLTNPRY
jgi:hypothetical protein